MNARTTGSVLSLSLHLLVLAALWFGVGDERTRLSAQPLSLDLHILPGEGAEQGQARGDTSPAAPPEAQEAEQAEQPPPEQSTAAPEPVAIRAVERKQPVRKKSEAQTPPPKEQPASKAKERPSPPKPQAAVQPEPASATDSAPQSATGQGDMGKADGAARATASPAGLPGGLYGQEQIDGALIPLKRTQPGYPAPARRRNIEGWVQVRFIVNEQGHTEQIQILAAEPEGVFEKSVISTIGLWRFRPGTIDGRRVRVLVEQTIRFQLR